jgi:hypothetical protein
MVDEFIIRMFNARNHAHVKHWTTESYSEHKALGKYYESLVGTLDNFIEAYQGVFGVVEGIPEKQDAKEMIKEELLWLTNNREEICNNVPALENILDELTALHMQTLYKLERLK